MKKLIIYLLPFVFYTAVSAQITDCNALQNLATYATYGWEGYTKNDGNFWFAAVSLASPVKGKDIRYKYGTHTLVVRMPYNKKLPALITKEIIACFEGATADMIYDKDSLLTLGTIAIPKKPISIMMEEEDKQLHIIFTSYAEEQSDVINVPANVTWETTTENPKNWTIPVVIPKTVITAKSTNTLHAKNTNIKIPKKTVVKAKPRITFLPDIPYVKTYNPAKTEDIKKNLSGLLDAASDHFIRLEKGDTTIKSKFLFLKNAQIDKDDNIFRTYRAWHDFDDSTTCANYLLEIKDYITKTNLVGKHKRPISDNLSFDWYTTTTHNNITRKVEISLYNNKYHQLIFGITEMHTEAEKQAYFKKQQADIQLAEAKATAQKTVTKTASSSQYSVQNSVVLARIKNSLINRIGDNGEGWTKVSEQKASWDSECLSLSLNSDYDYKVCFVGRKLAYGKFRWSNESRYDAFPFSIDNISSRYSFVSQENGYKTHVYEITTYGSDASGICMKPTGTESMVEGVVLVFKIKKSEYTKYDKYDKPASPYNNEEEDY